MSDIYWVAVAAAFATLCTVLLFGTGIPICWKILRSGNTSNISFFPFVIMFCNATLWFKYGLLKHDATVAYVNATGSGLTLCYIVIYYMHTSVKSLLHKQLVFGSLLLFPVLLYLRYYAEDRDNAIFYMGLVCATSGVLSYGSPLSAMGEVLKSRNTSSMTFSLSLGNFIVAIEWVFYGYLVQDLFIQVPNFLGFLLGIVQLFLFAKYPSSSQTSQQPVRNV